MTLVTVATTSMTENAKGRHHTSNISLTRKSVS
jgi:hypothetical protein